LGLGGLVGRLRLRHVTDGLGHHPLFFSEASTVRRLKQSCYCMFHTTGKVDWFTLTKTLPGRKKTELQTAGNGSGVPGVL